MPAFRAISCLKFLVAVRWALTAQGYEYSWPDYSVDILEQILYQQQGFNPMGLASGISPCNSDINAVTSGRTDSAEWFRTAYHDMSTANVIPGTGGLDASIGFETERPENVGKFINESIGFFTAFQSPVSSMADIIAVATVLTIGSCSNGSVLIPFSAGRIDATEAGPPGVPQPQDPLATHIADFARQGFDAEEMIGLVACGHTLGGVHGVDFPTIVPVLNDTNNEDSRVDFDGTVASFDNSVATQFVNNVTQNPLAFGPNVTTRSDHRIFTSDGGVVISKMAQSLDYFFSTCTSLLQRMLNTVPPTVTLVGPIPPILVKPDGVDLAVNTNGTLTFSGSVRLLEGEVASADTPPTVNIIYIPRNGDSCSNCSVDTTTSDDSLSGAFYNNTPTFRSYTWRTTILGSAGISGFRVEVINGGGSKTYGNGDSPFPLQDSLILESEASCSSQVFNATGSYYSYNMIASVLDSAHLSDVTFTAHKTATQQGSLAVKFVDESLPMNTGTAIGSTGYTSYTASFEYSFSPAVIVLDMIGITAQDEGETIGHPYILTQNLPQCA